MISRIAASTGRYSRRRAPRTPARGPAGEARQVLDGRTAASRALYPRLLGDSWYELAGPVRRMHLDGASFRGGGSFRVRHGTGRWARFLAWLVRMPRATGAADVRLTITPLGCGERWERSFDGRSLVTTQRGNPDGGLVERVGPLELRFRLEVRDGALFYRPAGADLRFGPLQLPLPRPVAPCVEAREEPDGLLRTRVRVIVTAPFAGLLVSYEGCVERWEAC